MFPIYGRPMYILSRPIYGGLFTHGGVLLQNGLVAHCRAKDGVVITTNDEFADGEDVAILKEISYEYYPTIMQKINQALRERRPYNLLNWNCWTFVDWLTGKKSENKESEKLLFIGVLGLTILALR